MLELTTRFAGISTSSAARGGGRAPRDGVRAAAAHIAYIDRPGAVGERASSGLNAVTPEEERARLREKAQARAAKGGKNGSRVLEKGIVSLPNSWPSEARKEACQRIAEHLAPPGSEASALVVSHRDKAGNSHLHFAAVDGVESVEAAKARRPGAKRLRRAQVIRLGDRGRPQQLRKELAEILNEIAADSCLDGVEWRSFTARGISRTPSRHEGSRARAMAEKKAVRELDAWFTAGGDLEPIEVALGLDEHAVPREGPQALSPAIEGPPTAPALLHRKPALKPPRKPQARAFGEER